MSHTKSTVFGLFTLLMFPVNAHADDADWEALFGEPDTTSVAEEPLAEEPIAGEAARIVLQPQNAGEWLSQSPFPAELSICEQDSANHLSSDFDLTFTVDAEGNGGSAAVSPFGAAPPAFLQCLSEIIQLVDFEAVGEARHYIQHIFVAPPPFSPHSLPESGSRNLRTHLKVGGVVSLASSIILYQISTTVKDEFDRTTDPTELDSIRSKYNVLTTVSAVTGVLGVAGLSGAFIFMDSDSASVQLNGTW